MPERKRYWGPETEKALSNFGPGSTPRRIIAAYAQVKLAASLIRLQAAGKPIGH